jgi:hypothetical protein
MASTFPKFRELPAELQLGIWNLALFPRVIEFRCVGQNAQRTFGTGRQYPVPRILNILGAHPVSFACLDGRNEALRKYKYDYHVSYHVTWLDPYGNTAHQYPVYTVQYNPLQDTVVFSDDDTLEIFCDFYDILRGNVLVEDIKVSPIKSIAFRGCQLPFHASDVEYLSMRSKMPYIARMFELEELILVNITVQTKWLSWPPQTTKESDRRIKEYVGNLEKELKWTSEGIIGACIQDPACRLHGKTWQDVVSRWWQNPTITIMTEDEFRERFYHPA